MRCVVEAQRCERPCLLYKSPLLNTIVLNDTTILYPLRMLAEY